MISDIKRKEINSVKELVDAYKNSIAEANKGLEHITEKYKKLMEEEKKSLKEQLSESKSQLKTWEKIFNSYDISVVKEALGENFDSDTTEIEPVENTDVSDDTVVDTLFGDGEEKDGKTENAGIEETDDDYVSEQELDSKREHEEIWGDEDDDDMPADESDDKQENTDDTKKEETADDDDWGNLTTEWE